MICDLKSFYTALNSKAKKTLLCIIFLFLLKPYIGSYNEMQLVCFITAIYGINYQSECIPFVNQTLPTDFICFTDNKDIISNGWKTDNTIYHDIKLDTKRIVKFYKMQWHTIPSLRYYDVVIWIDSNIEIISKYASESVVHRLSKNKILCWHHPLRAGKLYQDAWISSRLQKYKGQNVLQQYNDYVDDGYDDHFFKCLANLFHDDNINNSEYFGVWLTHFIAFDAKDQEVIAFLQEWFSEIKKYTTQDRISFSYICFKRDLIPYTLPDKEIYGIVHMSTQLYIIHD